jgi:muramoyltetrapeptide carboxypeptidase
LVIHVNLMDLVENTKLAMNRRSFVKRTSLIGAAATIPSVAYSQNDVPDLQRIIPKGIGKDATIGLITPGSSLTRSAFEKTLDNLSSIGYKIKYSPNVKVKSGFLAGTDQQRIEDIHSMFEDENVAAIFCARGGYGCGRLLDNINYDIIKKNHKPFLGYSDITALHLAFYKHAGLVTFHGPVGASEWNDFTRDSAMDILSKGKKVEISAEEVEIIHPGTAEGPLLGGNLTLMTSLIGTPHDPDFAGHILFLEEIGESTYRIDRMLTQMLSAGKLDKVVGIALGYFTDCDLKPEQTGYEQSIGLLEVFKDRLGLLNVPIAYGFPFGHEDRNATLPVGINARLNANKGSLKLLERATV